jgi:hypothetical protein
MPDVETVETCTGCPHIRWREDGAPVCAALGDVALDEEFCSDYDAPEGGLEPVPHTFCPWQGKWGQAPEWPEDSACEDKATDPMPWSAPTVWAGFWVGAVIGLLPFAAGVAVHAITAMWRSDPEFVTAAGAMLASMLFCGGIGALVMWMQGRRLDEGEEGDGHG